MRSSKAARPAESPVVENGSASVTEVRVHGVAGAAPETLLGTTSFRQIWGDRIAGFYGADGSVRDRAVEAYCWGGMTSRSSFRVLWLLLFPFMLANLAGWTCSARVRADRWLFGLHRGCGRLAALAVTLNLLLIASMTTMDLWAYQFGGQPLERSAARWRKAAHAVVDLPQPGRRLVIGAGVVAVSLLALALLSRHASRRYEQVAPVTGAHAKQPQVSAAALPEGVADPRFFTGAATVRRLGRLHVSAGLAWLTLLLVYLAGIASPTGWALAAAAAVLLVAAIVLVGCEATGGRWVTPLAVAVLWLAGVAAAYAWSRPAAGPAQGHHPGMKFAGNLSFALIFALTFLRLPAMPLVGALRRLGLRRGTDGAAVQQRCRRWPGAPFVVAAFGILSLNTVGLGCLLAVGQSLGSVQWRNADFLPGRAGVQIAEFPVVGDVLPLLTLGPGAFIALFLLVEFVRYRAAGSGPATREIIAEYRGRSDAAPPAQPPWDAWRRSALPDPGLPPGELKRAAKWARSVAQGRKLAGFAPDVRYLFTGLVVIAGLALCLALPMMWVDDFRPWRFAENLGVPLAMLIPATGLTLLRWGWQRPDARKWLGVLWDVGTFWPRAYHPFAPPCYAERAVPDLQRRVRWLHDSGERVLLVAHSQGTILAAAALAQQRDMCAWRERPVLVTFGSPLMSLYGWAFPAYLNGRVFDLLAGVGEASPVRCWRNFSYQTDYIGGPIGRDRVDVPLPDPETAWYVAGEPMPKMRRHTGYWSDAAMWRQIDALVAEPPARPTAGQEPAGTRSAAATSAG